MRRSFARFPFFSKVLLELFISIYLFLSTHSTPPKILKAGLLQTQAEQAAECHPWFFRDRTIVSELLPYTCHHLESTRGLGLFNEAPKNSKIFCTDKVLLSLCCSPCPQLTDFTSSSQWGPTRSIPYGITFCHSQDQTCPNKTCHSSGLSDEPTSSVEDIKHNPVAPQGIPPRYKTCLSSSQGQVSSCEWVFFHRFFPFPQTVCLITSPSSKLHLCL